MRAAILPGMFSLLVAGCSATQGDPDRLRVLRERSEILYQLASYDPRERNDAIHRLLSLGPERGADIVLEIMKDPYSEERVHVVAAAILAEWGDHRALPVLIGALPESGDAQEYAKQGLFALGPSTVPQVEESLTRGNEVERRAAAEILHDIGGPDAWDALASRIKDEPEPFIRWMLVCGIGKDHRDVAVDRLIDALTDPDEQVRRLAWDAVQMRANPPVAYDPAAPVDERAEKVGLLRLWRKGRLTGPVPETL